MQMLFQHDQDRGESLAAPGDRWPLTIRQVITYESFPFIFLLFTCTNLPDKQLVNLDCVKAGVLGP